MEGQAEFGPAGLCREAQATARRGGGGRRRLVDPATVVVAVDRGGGKVADPGETRLRDGARFARKDGVAGVAGRDGRQQVGRLRQCGGKRLARPDQRCGAGGCDPRRMLGAAGRSDDAPALRQEKARQGLGRIAVTDGKECPRHGPDYRGGGAVPQGCATSIRAARRGRSRVSSGFRRPGLRWCVLIAPERAVCPLRTSPEDILGRKMEKGMSFGLLFGFLGETRRRDIGDAGLRG